MKGGLSLSPGVNVGSATKEKVDPNLIANLHRAVQGAKSWQSASNEPSL